MSMSVSVTEFFFLGSSSLLSSPHISFVRVGGVVVVVGSCGGTDSGTKEDIDIEQQLYKIVRGKNFALNCLS